MPAERMNENTPFPTTWAWPCGNTNVRVPLPSHHLPLSADQRFIWQDPGKDLSLSGISCLPFLLISMHLWSGDPGEVPVLTQSYHFLTQLLGVPVGIATLGALGSSVCTVSCHKGITLIPKRCPGGCSYRGSAIVMKWQGSLNQNDPIYKAPGLAGNCF